MPKLTVKREEPTPPPATYVLELSEAEVRALVGVTGQFAVLQSDPEFNFLHLTHCKLRDAGVPYKRARLSFSASGSLIVRKAN